MPPATGFFLGLPAWAYPGWKDRFFPASPSRLAAYASVFNSVEGNTSFYSIPSAESVAKWCDDTPPEFRFCFKLPQSVTHRPRPDLGELTLFLDRVAPLGTRLGPVLVQFPASVDPRRLAHFESALSMVAERHEIVIEVRHPAFFDPSGRHSPELLERWLERFAAGRVMLDSRPIYEGDRRHPDVLDALHEKPDVPVLDTVYNELVFVRLILHPDVDSNDRYLDEWSVRVADWLGEGYRVFMMIHCPNYEHCPPLAADFHARLRKLTTLPALASWPVPEQQGLPGF